MIWRRIHHYANSFKIRSELLCELDRARRNGFPTPAGIRRRVWKEPHRYDDFVRFLRFLDPRDRIEVFDVGANVGNWAAECLEFFPAAQITCLEPVPATFQSLRDRFANDRRVKVIGAGASDSPGTAEMIVDESSERSSLHEYSRTQDALDIKFTGRTSVDLIRLDSLLLDREAKARLLKIDVQGHEAAAMSGATAILPEVDVLILECSFNVEYKDVTPSFSTVCHLAELAGLRPFHFRNFGRALSPYAWERDVIFVQQKHLDRLWGW
jgi:FkbM family methyltransferase